MCPELQGSDFAIRYQIYVQHSYEVHSSIIYIEYISFGLGNKFKNMYI